MDGQDDAGTTHDHDPRAWVEFIRSRDRLTAGMTCTYLEEAGVEARVRSADGNYVVEVPDYQLSDAMLAYEPSDSNIVPAMSESLRHTDAHVSPPLQEALKNPLRDSDEHRLERTAVILRWVFRIIVILVLIALLIMVFAGCSGCH